MKRILLIQPFPFDRVKGIRYSNRLPLGLLFLAETLDHKKYKVFILDLSIQSSDFDFLSYLHRTTPDVVGVSIHSTGIAEYSLKLCKEIREIVPSTKLVLGGAHASVCHQELLEHDYIDYIVRGEAEISFGLLCDAIFNDIAVKDIQGICFRNSDGCHDGGLSPPPKLDELPLLTFSQISLSKYDLNVTDMGHSQTVNLITSRGCPYSCAYCSYKSVSPQKVRFMAPESLIRQMKLVHQVFGISSFYFLDDDFFLSEKKIAAFLNELEHQEIKFAWRCQTRADSFLRNIERITDASRLGLKHVSFGLESGDQAVLDHVNKRISLIDVYQAIKTAKQNGIKVRVFLMVGLPYQDMTSIDKTVAFLRDTNPDEIMVQTLVPYPGSPIFADPKKWGVTLSSDSPNAFISRTDWLGSEQHELRPVIETKWMSAREISDAKAMIWNAFKEIRHTHSGALSL